MIEVEGLFNRLDREARAGGYLLNPNKEDTLALCEGLLTNTKRYGYQSCPCRVADGVRDRDLDIICPCDYRDSDLNDWGACYCALYVTSEWMEQTTERLVVPERRPPPSDRHRPATTKIGGTTAAAGPPVGQTAAPLAGKYPVWRCTVCGYLCSREKPPNVCPICKVTAERFERFA
jgi:ferredoxin-thioredoxin reductase catalytic subunit